MLTRSPRPSRGEHQFATWQAVLERSTSAASNRCVPDAPPTLVQIRGSGLCRRTGRSATLTAAQSCRADQCAPGLACPRVALPAMPPSRDREGAHLDGPHLSLGSIVVAAGLSAAGGTATPPGSAGLATWHCRKSPGWRQQAGVPAGISARERGARACCRTTRCSPSTGARSAARSASAARQAAQTVLLSADSTRTESLESTSDRRQIDQARVPLGLLEWRIEKRWLRTRLATSACCQPHVSDQATGHHTCRISYVLEPLGQQPARDEPRVPAEVLQRAGHRGAGACGAVSDRRLLDRSTRSDRTWKSSASSMRADTREPSYWKRRFDTRRARGDRGADAMLEFRGPDRPARSRQAWELGHVSGGA